LVKIRLKRMGAKRRPFYRLIVADSQSPRDGRFIDQLGYYDPLTDPATIKIDEEKVSTWLSRGAQPSESARELLRRSGVIGGGGGGAKAEVTATGPAPRKQTAVAEATDPTPVESKSSEGGDA
jgi:small subunit ribosomal protein S16